jgi:hypothetical protein
MGYQTMSESQKSAFSTIKCHSALHKSARAVVNKSTTTTFRGMPRPIFINTDYYIIILKKITNAGKYTKKLHNHHRNYES